MPADRTAIVHTVEGGHALGIPDDHLRVLLFWRLRPEVKLARGLTPMGREVIELMVELRMVPDVTHCTPTARRLRQRGAAAAGRGAAGRKRAWTGASGRPSSAADRLTFAVQ